MAMTETMFIETQTSIWADLWFLATYFFVVLKSRLIILPNIAEPQQVYYSLWKNLLRQFYKEIACA